MVGDRSFELKILENTYRHIQFVVYQKQVANVKFLVFICFYGILVLDSKEY